MNSMKNKITGGLTNLVIGATAGGLVGCAGQNLPEPQKAEVPILNKAPISYVQPKPIQRESEAERIGRQALEYVKRNDIDLSVLEKGESVTGMYFVGEGDRNKVVFTNYAAPIVKEMDALLNNLNRERIKNSNARLRKGDFSDSFGEIDKMAKDVEFVINCLDKGCAGPKYFNKQDHMITGKEANKSVEYIKSYIQAQRNKENQRGRK